MAYMSQRAAVVGSMAQCFVTIDGNRYEFGQALSLEAVFDKNKIEIPILGRTVKGNRAVGGKGTGSATFHFNTSVFRKLMIDYMKTGQDFYFDIQVVNEDPTSIVGSQVVILTDCNLDSAVMAKFDTADNYLEDTFNFTFEGAEMPTEFTPQDGLL